MRVLVADDSRTTRQLLQSLLAAAGHDVVSTSDGAEALAQLQAADPPLLAILDWVMPGMDGIDLCRELRRRGGEPYVYLILLTGKDEPDNAVEALNAGADDFLTKPFKPAELTARVRAGQRIVELQQELRTTRDALRREARRDPLTDAFNRRAIEEILRVEHARAARQGQPLAVAFVDLDHFKRVNDTFGHSAGDAVLIAAVTRMNDVLRPYDNIGRIGGEELLVALPGCDTARALAVAERLRASIAAKPVLYAGKPISVTASIGVAASDRAGTLDPDVLRTAADAALYRAKEKGRNRIEAA